MPIKQSAKKAAKQAIKKRAVNVQFKEAMKSAVKAFWKAIDTKAKNIADLALQAQKRIDKASKRNIISDKSAARKKATLMKAVNDAGASLTPKKTPAKKTTTKKPAAKRLQPEKQQQRKQQKQNNSN